MRYIFRNEASAHHVLGKIERIIKKSIVFCLKGVAAERLSDVCTVVVVAVAVAVVGSVARRARKGVYVKSPYDIQSTM